MERTRVVIMGAAGRDFHDFNVVYRDDPGVEVVAFTATQIPGIDDRRYPPELAGELYPDGIPILPEGEKGQNRSVKEDAVIVPGRLHLADDPTGIFNLGDKQGVVDQAQVAEEFFR